MSLCICTRSQGPALLGNPINVKAFRFRLICASSDSLDESVHWQNSTAPCLL